MSSPSASTPRIPYPAAARSLLRDTVMTAVDDLIRSRGWSATTMAHVATAAGVSRQTLYNEFGSRSSLVEAYVTREIDTLINQVTDAVRAHADDAHLALRTAFSLFLKLASDEPVVQLIVDDAEDGELHRLLTGLGQAVAGARIAQLIPEVWPQVAAGDAQLLADTLVRLAISHALMPGPDPASIARGIGRMLAPFVDELLNPQAETGSARRP